MPIQTIGCYASVSRRVDGLNLRAEPKVDPNIKPLDALNPGDRLWVFRTDDSGRWALVKVLKSGELGYVAYRHIDLDQEKPAPLNPIPVAPLWPYIAGAVLFLAVIAYSAYRTWLWAW